METIWEISFWLQKLKISVDSLLYQHSSDEKFLSFKRGVMKTAFMLCLATSIVFSSGSFAMPPQQISFIEMEQDIEELELEAAVIHYLDQYRGDLPVELIETIIIVESEGNPRAVSWAGFKMGAGLMQISEIGAKEYNYQNGTNYTHREIYEDVDLNIKVGCFLLNYYNELLGGLSHEELYVAYNAGPGSYQRYYRSHYSKGIMPGGGKYSSLNRFNRIAEEYKQGLWTLSFNS